ncbi:MAG: Asp-tRNA(Asn)/Glu-tRNA(Gln) amidotransferase subunit GatC [bacterium]|nr:Asp-tRNA(Asn)/Glu-tRNA(Gln) amidotransferase subunit GatC [bacterium]
MDIKHVASLANLPLTAAEEQTYSPQLDQVLDYVQQLQQTDTAKVGETNQVTGTKNITRSDDVAACPPLVTGFIKVPAIFGDE